MRRAVLRRFPYNLIYALHAPDGSYVVRVRRKRGTAYSIDDTPPTIAATSAGVQYTASAYVRAKWYATGDPIQIVLRERAPSDAVVASAASALVPLTRRYQQISVTATATASGNELEVHGRVDSGALAHRYLPRPGPYHDGSRLRRRLQRRDHPASRGGLRL
jgi:hypothetical protein